MFSFFSVIQQPEVWQTLIAVCLIAALLAVLGIFVVLRNLAFFSDGLAHTALAGLAVGVVLNQSPLMWALAAALLFAVVIFFLEKKTDLLPDTLIGILFTASLALGVVLLHSKNGGDPEELENLLFGDIGSIVLTHVYLIAFAALIIGGFIIANYKKYLFLCLNKELAYVAGIKTELYRLLLYISLSVIIILGIKIFGVILISALILIPVSAAKLFARSTLSLFWLSLIFSQITVVIGFFCARAANLPVSSIIVLTGAFIFIAGLIVKTIFVKK